MGTVSHDEIAHDFSPYFRVLKDGSIDRLLGTDFVPPSLNPKGVSSKDVQILPESGVSARLYLPKLADPTAKNKLPILVYYHGGAFCIATAFCSTYDSFLNTLVSEANVVAVSVDYRRAPEHPIPTAYDDSWAALKWVLSHSSAGGPEPWLAQHGDLNRIFLGGDSAGASITHNLLLRAGGSKLNIKAGILLHPYFCGSQPIGNEIADPVMKAIGDGMWRYACPSTRGLDDPLINPTSVGAPSLSGVGCERAMVCVAEKDVWRDRGWEYYKALRASEWEGEAEMVEAKGEDHVFFLLKPDSEQAQKMRSRLASFMNFDSAASFYNL